MTDSSNRKTGLDSIRALAIVCVLVSHGRHFFDDLIPAKILKVVALGYIGVELFFVLSGFLIGTIMLASFSNELSPHVVLNFWKRRWFRTLPNYFLAIVTTGLITVILSGFSWDTFKVASLHLVFLQNLHQNCHQWFYPVSWSLAVEEWFYLTAPVVFLFFSCFYGERRRVSFLVSILSIIFLPTLLRLFFAESVELWGRDLRAVVLYRLDAIGFGLLAAWLFKYKKKLFQCAARFKCCVGLSLLAFCHLWVVFYSSNAIHGSSFFGRVIIFSLTSFGAMLVLPYATIFKGFGNKRFDDYVTRVAVWSYSIYLYHMFFIDFSHWLFARGGGSYSLLNALGGFLIAMMLTLTVCWFVYEFYEIRMTRWLRRRFSDKENKLAL